MSVKFDKPYPGDYYPGKGPNPDAEVVSIEALRGERGSSTPMSGQGGEKLLPVRPGTTNASRTGLLGERGSSAPMSGNQKKSY